jgi:hypothetical protein
MESFTVIFTIIMPLIKKKRVIFRISVSGTHLLILWEFIADPLRSADHTFGTTVLSAF